MVRKNGIYTDAFYNWISKICKTGYTIPESEAKSNTIPTRQDVVKVDVVHGKYRWLRNSSEIKLIIRQQFNWLMSGGEIE